MTTAHARANPSSYALIAACHAALQLQESVPPLPETDEEAEGTAAHLIALEYARGNEAAFPIGTKFVSGGREWKVDADMHAGAKMYTRAIGGPYTDEVIAHRAGVFVFLERPVTVPRVHPESWGTPDARIYFNDARLAYAECPPGLPAERFNAGTLKLLRIGDYKFGHRYVEVFENLQLGAGYATGALDEAEWIDHDPNVYVELIIVQPRSYHPEGAVRIWRIQAAQLRPITNIVHTSVYHALGPNPEAKTGPHCIDCKARHVCRALQINTGRIADFAMTAERVELPPSAVGQELLILDDAIKQLEARRSGLAAQAETLIRGGQLVPHYSMQPGQARLTYFENADTDELISMGDLVGVNLRKKLERKDLVVTPTQAIQLGIDKELMRSYADRPRGAMKLTRDSTITVRKVFSK